VTLARVGTSVARRSVLVVDGDRRTRGLTIERLGNTSTIVEVEDTVNALKVLAAPGRRVDIVIATCLLARGPGQYRAGVKLVHTMFQRWPWVTIVVVTGGRRREQVMTDVLLGGTRRFLTRRFGIAALGRSLDRAVRSLHARAPAAPHVMVLMRRSLPLLSERIGDHPTLGELAATAAMSRSHFSRVFHGAVGMSLRDYVARLRLNRATELMLGSALSLTAVAVEAGFYDLPHFDKVFRHRFRMSPQQFRVQQVGAADAGVHGRRGRRH